VTILLVAGSLGLAASRPLAFQKYNTLRPGGEVPPIVGDPLDIASLVAAIPYERSAGEVLAVYPESKHRRTILEGSGDCSEKAFGLGWQLLGQGADFQIVHFINPDGLETGEAHTVIRVRFEYGPDERVGLVDLLDGGLPSSGGGFLDVADISAGPVPDFEFVSLNPAARGSSEYYGSFLEDVFVGYVPAKEVEGYFAFLDRIYVPLGHERLEKYLYDGIALLAGVLPRVYVPDYERFAEGQRADLWLHRSALWTIRLGVFALPLLLILELRNSWRRDGR